MSGKNKKLIPAVILSSHTIGLGVIRALGERGVPISVMYYEKNDMGYVSRYVQNKIYIPHPERDMERFIDVLIEFSGRNGKSFLIAADDATLMSVSLNKALLEKYFIVACPEWNIVNKYIDKKNTAKLAEEIGVPVPKTIVPCSLEDVGRHGESVQYPCLIKPTHSHRYFDLFKKKMTKVDNIDQMVCAYKEAKKAGVEVMIQEFIPGDDTMGVNYNSYFWEGQPLVEFTAAKERLSPPETGVPRVAVSRHIPEVIESGRKIVNALGFYGYSCTEFKKDPRDGVYKLMEVNGRHNRSALLAVRCGINFPWIEYNHLTLGVQPSNNGYRREIYWIDEFRDIMHSTKYFRKEPFSLSQYIRPYISSHVFAVFDWKDPLPFLKRCFDILKTAIRMMKIH